MFVCFFSCFAVEVAVLVHHKKNFLFSAVVRLVWFSAGNTEVRLFATDSIEHAFNMYNCLLKSVLNFSDIESGM